MKVNYLYTLCLFKVDRLFYKLAIPKYICVFVTKLSKEKKYFMFGWTWEIEDKMYCLLLTWVSVWYSAPYFHSSVSNVNFVLWRGHPEIFSVCPDVDSMCWITEKYLLLVARNLLKYILLLFIFLVLRHFALLVARNWSLAWAWYEIIVIKIDESLNFVAKINLSGICSVFEQVMLD